MRSDVINWLSGLLTQDTAPLTAGFAVFATLLVVYGLAMPSGAVNARARAQFQRRRDSRVDPSTPTGAKTREQLLDVVRRLLERLKLTRGSDMRKASDFLAQAGWRMPEALTIFFGARLTSPIILGSTIYLLAPMLIRHVALGPRLLISLAGVAAGAFAPSIFVANASENRRKKIQLSLPDALDLFVICAEAGLSLDAAMSRVARELGPAAPELADELGLTAVELAFLPNRRDALANLSKRIPTSSIRNLVATFTQTERYGTPLAQSLRVLAGEFRDNRMMKAEEKAARLPAILTVPMMLFILPPLFVVLLGPAIIQILNSLPK